MARPMSRDGLASLVKATDVEEITAIAVMGVTGSGKSNFIKHATSSDRVRVGHNLQSCIQSSPHMEIVTDKRRH